MMGSATSRTMSLRTIESVDNKEGVTCVIQCYMNHCLILSYLILCHLFLLSFHLNRSFPCINFMRFVPWSFLILSTYNPFCLIWVFWCKVLLTSKESLLKGGYRVWYVVMKNCLTVCYLNFASVLHDHSFHCRGRWLWS